MIYVSTCHNPWANIAYEEYLMNQVRPGDFNLYLWQNHHTVVIGKNQNAWRECDWKKLEEDGGYLMRRPSGGGAVYHDLGNLCFTMVTDRKQFDLQKQFSFVVAVLGSLGLSATFSGRNDILVQEKKVSGNAFTLREDRAVHHGTLLVSTDMSQLAKYLIVPPEKMQSKGIASVKARVANLTDFDPAITVDKVKNAFYTIYRELFDECEVKMVDTLHEVPAELYEKYASWEWRFGQNPTFDWHWQKWFNWGNIEIGFLVKAGVVKECKIYSDAMDATMIEQMASCLTGLSFTKEEIIRKWQAAPLTEKNREQWAEVISWLQGMAF